MNTSVCAADVSSARHVYRNGWCYPKRMPHSPGSAELLHECEVHVSNVELVREFFHVSLDDQG